MGAGRRKGGASRMGAGRKKGGASKMGAGKMGYRRKNIIHKKKGGSLKSMYNYGKRAVKRHGKKVAKHVTYAVKNRHKIAPAIKKAKSLVKSVRADTARLVQDVNRALKQ